MKIRSIRIVGIRCFEDTGPIDLSPKCNIFVGQNNAGKSTLLRGITAFQGFMFADEDIRHGSAAASHELLIDGFRQDDHISLDQPTARSLGAAHVQRVIKGGSHPWHDGMARIVQQYGNPVFVRMRPYHAIVPFLARRKAQQYEQDIRIGVQQEVRGNFTNLYSRIDLLAPTGHPRHKDFERAVKEIVGVDITTKSSASGKEAGFWLDEDFFVTLERMGDGVAELVGLIAELCVDRNKIFVLEEPETNLHPKALKALMRMVLSSSANNQFVISTHSNIVVRELGSDEATKVFRVSRDEADPMSPSAVEELPRTQAAHTALLRELGYEFTDFGLHEVWLFVEEASAEGVIRDILVPFFAPKLLGRLRTFSAAGVSNVGPSVAEFQRLVTFIHLQPAYEGRMWIRTDSGAEGEDVIAKLRGKFGYLTADTCATFTKAAFEKFYPEKFQPEVERVLVILDKNERRKAKAQLLTDVLAWTEANPEEAKTAWQVSAAEPIKLVKMIEATLV